MLVIKNIGYIIGMMCNGHKIKNAKFNPSTKRYVFTFNIPSIKRMGPHKNDDIEVMLEAIPNSMGEYQLYVMGWHTVTYININKSEISNPTILARNIGRVLDKLKLWYSN
jgi:hypothetical protein